MNRKSNATKGRKNCLFIVFEGFSGSGKSTIAKLLAEDINGIYITSAPKFIGHIRAVLGKDRNLEERFAYYLLGNIYCSEIAKHEIVHHPVICDRYMHSTFAIHSLLGAQIAVDVSTVDLLHPDINFFLFTSDEKERKQRVDLRNKKNKYDEMLENDAFRIRYLEYFKSVGGFIFIDTAGRTISDLLIEVKKQIIQKVGY